MVAFLAIVACGCSGEEVGGGDNVPTDSGAAMDAEADSGAAFGDVTVGDSTTGDECPGGAGCTCTANDECDTALCIETPTGKECARHCIENCPDGYQCTPVTGPGGDAQTICVPKWARLCDPCTESKQCAALGLTGSACVDQGAAGGFCGVKCLSDLQCPADYACKDVKTVEGNDARLCVKRPDSRAQSAFGACACSPAAKASKLATTCTVEKIDGGKSLVCKGVRACGKDGLSDCTANDPEQEKCDGEDNDCDGEIDEDSCDDGNDCTNEVCAGDKGCASTDLNGVPCNDNNACTESDKCAKGVCVPGAPKQCDDGNPCTKDTCDLSSGCTQTADDFKPCTDDNPCTLGDTCKGQVCKPGKDKECSTAQACQVAQCSLVDGKCAFSNATTGKSCDDGDACTKDDGCDGGVCLGSKVTCDDANPCTDDFCDGKKGCDAKHNVAPCEDGNPCTIGDKCGDGGCKGGTNKGCDDGNPCTADTCDPKTGGCSGDGAPLEGKACDADGSACTEGDACKKGKCTVGPPKKCDDGNTCTEDDCDKVKGCIAKPKYAGACDADGTPCTVDDSCNNGVCKAGAQKKCDDGNKCTTGTCKADDGKCHYLALPNGQSCGPDGAKCQFAVCIEGCKPKHTKKCHNDNVFWFDSCGKPSVVQTQCKSDQFCESEACKDGQYAGKYYVTADPDTKSLGALGTAKFVPLTLEVLDWGGGLLQGDFSLNGQKYSFTGKRTGKNWAASVTWTQAGTLPITHKMVMNVLFKADPAKTGKPLPDLFTGTINDTLTASGFQLGQVVWNVTGKKL